MVLALPKDVGALQYVLYFRSVVKVLVQFS